MMHDMRTTLTVDDSLFRTLKTEANERGMSFKEIVNTALRIGLRHLDAPDEQSADPRTPTFSMGYPRGGLDKALQLASELENEEIATKMAVRK